MSNERRKMQSACSSLVKKRWRPYDTSKVNRETGGIYVIGDNIEQRQITYDYVGRTDDLRRRLNAHKYSENQKISSFVKEEFERNSGENLRIKWIETEDHKCEERIVLECIEEEIGYKPLMNMRAGDEC
ncbi:uncharacterized protein LOC122964761 [Acropora millepora]|uniref:uncharacterized protein LOC122964761 n=1 Tax=Acropora millepora TaxID=45264 RepID=UPI001CF182FF|nr:uncharacterized protein LOC122964761 [Acropora millepora]